MAASFSFGQSNNWPAVLVKKAAMPPFSIGINWHSTDRPQLASCGIPDYANERSELDLSALPTRNRIYRAI
ncbi:MAG: hypothetical protein ABJA10_00740, partial [Aestuariivirga sp.]